MVWQSCKSKLFFFSFADFHEYFLFVFVFFFLVYTKWAFKNINEKSFCTVDYKILIWLKVSYFHNDAEINLLMLSLD